MSLIPGERDLSLEYSVSERATRQEPSVRVVVELFLHAVRLLDGSEQAKTVIIGRCRMPNPVHLFPSDVQATKRVILELVISPRWTAIRLDLSIASAFYGDRTRRP